ncbi:MAG: PIN domain-containing protein [Cyclobacteriaceae bacterium]
MKIFLDANVLVSVLNKEYPIFAHSSRVLSLADNAQYQLCTSTICLAIAFYFAEKKSGAQKAKEKISLLISKIDIVESNKNVALQAANDKQVLDFEDGLEYYSALYSGCQYIITEDLNDYYFSKIEVMTSEQFMTQVISR